MHIVIPMSGLGERFLSAGYKEIKPLIDVDGAPVIKFVVSMFETSDRFTFICNEQHLAETSLKKVLQELVPNSEILPIASHKNGPVYAVAQCFDAIKPQEETIVNYCDFYSYWDYNDFQNFCHKRKCAGAIPAYRNFHPHMLGSDNYAFMLHEKQWLKAIQEKMPFTDNRMQEYASNGTYYFSRGEYIHKYFAELMKRENAVNGEYYVSMVYNLLVEDGLPVSIYEVQHMLQWGTPTDLREYQRWSDYFAGLVEKNSNGSNALLADVDLIPMAGLGVRFSQEGYDLPKPLVPVSGKPMVVQACQSLPPGKRYIFVARTEHLTNTPLDAVLHAEFPHTSVVPVAAVTEGQAISCSIGLEEASPPVDDQESVLIGACDNGMVYDHAKFERLLESEKFDAMAFSFRNHPSSARKPQMYSWIRVDDPEKEFPEIKSVSMKKAISDTPARDHAVVGAFYFKSAKVFRESLNLLKKKNVRVNGEFYADSLIDMAIELGHRCVVFEIDDYICFGTPDDLRTFEYWQSFFHKCAWHPYSIEKDPSVGAHPEALLRAVNARQLQPFA